jgi:transcriptional regulator with PAS, ATPase and Fis domain
MNAAALEDTGPICLSPAMRRVYQMVDRVAVGTISVLVLGETGVGKEVLAEAIHRRSQRAPAPFVRLNCAALSETLIESELFGYERGAFTGAMQHKVGLLESADRGTVFLDEIGELSPAMQVKLLRVLESREVMRVGSLRPKQIDVRFVAATHRDLEARVHAGAFREDLYFRLSGVAIEIPPLRERVEEVHALAEQFAAITARALGRPIPRFTTTAIARLRGHGWPGNIRELRNCVERAVLLAETDQIDADQIVVSVRTRLPTPEPGPAVPRVVIHGRTVVLDREQVIAALARAAGNQKIAAQILQISRRTLINKLDVFGIDRPRKGRA